jgi:S1-C subfamily serine protease
LKPVILVLFFVTLCFTSKSQTKDDATLSLGDPLLIVVVNAPKFFGNIKTEISNYYRGVHTVTNYYAVVKNPDQFENYRHVLSISITQAGSVEGRYTGVYILTDVANDSQVQWTFHSDDRTPNMVELFSMLSTAAADPNLGYMDVFGDNQEFLTDEAPEVKLNAHSAKVSSVPESLLATFLITSDDGQGSGFFIDSKHAITNYHVVGSRKTVVGTDNEGTKFEMSVVETDPENDLALLKTKDDYISFFYFPVGDSLDSNIVGKEVFAIGSPASEELINSVSGGIVSGIRTFDDQEIIQINAPVNPGNSGGPLIDDQGVLQGVVVAKIAGLSTEGIAFAISKEQITKSFNLTTQ